MKRSILLAIVLAACDETSSQQRPDASSTVTGDAGAAGPRAVVVSGVAGESGIMSALDLGSLQVTENLSPAGGVGGDPIIRRIADTLYVISRYDSNAVSLYDAKTLQFQEQYGTGAGTNPQDVTRVGDTLYFALDGGGGLVKVKLGSGQETSIDLAGPLGDPDGNPNCVSVLAVGTRVFVACGVLDPSYIPRGSAKLAIVDTADGDAITSIDLPSTNPQGLMLQSPASSIFGGDLLIPLTPSFTDYSMGCVARVSTGASPAASCAAGLSNSDLGGIVAHIDVAPDNDMLWFAITTIDSSFMNPTGTLRGFDMSAGIMRPASSPPAQLIVDAAACPDGSIVVLDRKKDLQGIRVYKDGVERTTEPLPFGLPPLFGNNTVCYDPAAL